MKAVFALVLVLPMSVGLAQGWAGPYRLTDSPADDINPSACKDWLWCNMTCLVWQTHRSGNWDIYSRFCTFMNGNGWGPEMPVCTTSGDDINPAVAFCNDWQDHPSYWCVWERPDSAGHGSIWGSFITWRDEWWPPVRIAATSVDTAWPSVVVVLGPPEDTVWVAWLDNDGSEGSIIRYSFYDRDSWHMPAVAVYDSVPMRHVRIGRGRSSRHNWAEYPLLVWERLGGDIYYSEYVNGAWTLPAPVAPSPARDRNPDVISSREASFLGPWITWESTRDGDTAIYGTAADTFSIGRRWCDATAAGANFQPSGTAAEFTTRFWEPLVAVWVSDRGGNPDIYSTGQFGGSDIFVDNDTATDLSPTLTTFGVTMLWCCWQSNRTGNWDIFGSYIYCVGLEEGRPSTACGPRPVATVVRDVLYLPALGVKRGASSILLDTSGRKVLELAPGANDVSRLPPGVYFVRERSAVHKVVVTR
jgi:hypothetical protein